MGNTSSSESRKKIVLDAIEQKINDGLKLAETQDCFSLDIFTGYRLELKGHDKVKVQEATIESLSKLPWCINISIQKLKREETHEIYVGLVSILPVSKDVLIDQNTSKFDYDYDNFLLENQLSIERLVTGPKRKDLDVALNDLIFESQRILLLYDDKFDKEPMKGVVV